MFPRKASVALSLLPCFSPKTSDMALDTVSPALYVSLVAVVDGAEDLGADETAFAAGEAFNPAAVEPEETLLVPAGVDTLTVFDFSAVVDALEVEAEDFAAEAALEDFESLEEAAEPVEPPPLLPPVEPPPLLPPVEPPP